MLGRDDCVTRRCQARRQLSDLEFPLRAQPRKFEPRHLDARDLMPGLVRALGVCIGESVAQMRPGGIRMALDDRDLLQHARSMLPACNTWIIIAGMMAMLT